MGHILSLAELKEVLKEDPGFDSATVCLYGLRAIYEEGFCLFLRHEYGVDAERHFRGNTISGCDRSVAPQRGSIRLLNMLKCMSKSFISLTQSLLGKGDNLDKVAGFFQTRISSLPLSNNCNPSRSLLVKVFSPKAEIRM